MTIINYDPYEDPETDPHTYCAGCKALNEDGTFYFIHPDTDAGRYLEIDEAISLCPDCANKVADELGSGMKGLFRGRPL